jgi:hypothetical protein
MSEPPLGRTIAGLLELAHDASWQGGRRETDLGCSVLVGVRKRMDAAMDDPGDVFYSDARERTQRVVAGLLKDSGLRVRELTYELVITNPRDPEKGQVHIAYEDGFVSWERVVWDYWGQFETLAKHEETQVAAAKIIEVLRGAH